MEKELPCADHIILPRKTFTVNFSSIGCHIADQQLQGIDGPLPAHLPGPSCKYNGLAALYTTFYS
jgi:hypothetical protein